MGSASVSSTANSVGRYVRRKISEVQGISAGKRPQAASARLARWRRMGMMGDAPSLVYGEEVLDGWPIEELGSPDGDSRAFKAVSATLELYAWHQQSKSYPVAVFATKESGKRRSFARACREAQFELEHAGGFRSRLASVEAATDFDGVVLNVRGLIRLLKSAKDLQGTPRQLAFDYEALARDLFLIQMGNEAKSRVVARWGADYFCVSKPTEKEAPKDGPETGGSEADSGR